MASLPACTWLPPQSAATRVSPLLEGEVLRNGPDNAFRLVLHEREDVHQCMVMKWGTELTLIEAWHQAKGAGVELPGGLCALEIKGDEFVPVFNWR